MTGDVRSLHGIGRPGDHASGWALRWRRRAGAPRHAVSARGVARPYRTAIGVLSAALIGALGLFGGTAYAYFTASASASGTASVGSVQPVTITATATPTSQLVPGGSADLALHVYNPNAFSVTITALAAGTGPVGVVGGTGCTPTNAAVTVSPKTGLSFPLTAGATTTIHISNGAAMKTDSFTGCQTAVFHLPVKLTVKK